MNDWKGEYKLGGKGGNDDLSYLRKGKVPWWKSTSFHDLYNPQKVNPKPTLTQGPKNKRWKGIRICTSMSICLIIAQLTWIHLDWKGLWRATKRPIHMQTCRHTGIRMYVGRSVGRTYGRLYLQANRHMDRRICGPVNGRKVSPTYTGRGPLSGLYW